MLFNVNVAAVVALALAMSAYATPFDSEFSKPGAPAVPPPVPRDVGAPAGQGPTVKLDKPTDSDPTVLEAKSYGGHSKRENIEELL